MANVDEGTQEPSTPENQRHSHVLVTKSDLQLLKKELLAEFQSLLHNKSPKRTIDGQEWVKTHEVVKWTGISPRTLRRLRKSSTILAKKVGGIYYYNYPSLQQFLIT